MRNQNIRIKGTNNKKHNYELTSLLYSRFLLMIFFCMFFSSEICFCITLPETNIAPEHVWLEDEFPIGKSYFQVQTLRGFHLFVATSLKATGDCQLVRRPAARAGEGHRAPGVNTYSAKTSCRTNESLKVRFPAPFFCGFSLKQFHHFFWISLNFTN